MALCSGEQYCPGILSIGQDHRHEIRSLGISVLAGVNSSGSSRSAQHIEDNAGILAK